MLRSEVDDILLPLAAPPLSPTYLLCQCRLWPQSTSTEWATAQRAPCSTGCPAGHTHTERERERER